MQAREHCFCGGDHYRRFGEVSNCNTLCGGDAQQRCGGGWANLVFQIGEERGGWEREGELSIPWLGSWTKVGLPCLFPKRGEKGGGGINFTCSKDLDL